MISHDLSHRRAGRSGFHLPQIALGFWHGFGDGDAYAPGRELVLHALERGIDPRGGGRLGVVFGR